MNAGEKPHLEDVLDRLNQIAATMHFLVIAASENGDENYANAIDLIQSDTRTLAKSMAQGVEP
jgi:hypothetical protein